MKINKIIALLALIIVASCEPIEDRAVLTNTYDPNNIEVEVIQKSAGSNEITLILKSPEISGYWDYNTGISLSNEASFIYPIFGKATFTFYVASPYLESDGSSKFITKTVEVDITTATASAGEAYSNLAGSIPTGKKTWVFDGAPNDNRFWWFMTGISIVDFNLDDLSSHNWWNAGGGEDRDSHPADAAGKMVFDLNGAANYYHYATKDGEPTKGAYSISPDFKTITFIGANILGNEYGAEDGVYQIVQLTPDKLVLYNPYTAAGGSGWMWVFKTL